MAKNFFQGVFAVGKKLVLILLWNAIMDLKNKDAGSFCMRISDNMSMQGIFSEIIQSVDPHWIVSTAKVDDYTQVILHTFADVIDAKHKYTKKPFGTGCLSERKDCPYSGITRSRN
jgi:hypothetical protein